MSSQYEHGCLKTQRNCHLNTPQPQIREFTRISHTCSPLPPALVFAVVGDYCLYWEEVQGGLPLVLLRPQGHLEPRELLQELQHLELELTWE